MILFACYDLFKIENLVLPPSCTSYGLEAEPEAGVDQSRALWTRIFTIIMFRNTVLLYKKKAGWGRFARILLKI